jgi:hypothetical protein
VDAFFEAFENGSIGTTGVGSNLTNIEKEAVAEALAVLLDEEEDEQFQNQSQQQAQDGGGNSESQANVGGAYERFFYWLWGGDSWLALLDEEGQLVRKLNTALGTSHSRLASFTEAELATINATVHQQATPTQAMNEEFTRRENTVTGMDVALKTSDAALTAAGLLVGAQSGKQITKNIIEYAVEQQTGIPVSGLPTKKTSVPGRYRPNRRLPTNQHGVPIPSSNTPHTQLGTRHGRNGDYTQAREFGENGSLIKDIDFTDHGRPNNHTNPHQHIWQMNPTGGCPMRNKISEPLAY